MTKLASVPAEEKARRMGITLTYRDMSNEDMGEALKTMDAFTKWKDTKDIWRFNKFMAAYKRELNRCGQWYRKLVNKHAELEPQKRKNAAGELEEIKDKDGKPILKPKFRPNPQTGQMDILFKDKAAFEHDLKVFHSQTVTVKVQAFDADDFVKAELTPLQLRACATLLDNVDPDLMAAFDDEEDAAIENASPELQELLKDDPVEASPEVPPNGSDDPGSSSASQPSA